MEASCDRGVKGDTKETEEGILKAMLYNCVYFTEKDYSRPTAETTTAVLLV